MTNKVIKKKMIAKNIFEFEIKNENVATHFKPGQFIIITSDEKAERIPITIVDSNYQNKSIIIIVQNIGYSTNKISNLNENDEIYNITGPLGNPSNIGYLNGIIVIIGGGVGIAAIYPYVKTYKSLNNYIISIIGSKTIESIFYEENIKKYSDELYVATDDGSKGEKGFVTDILLSLISKRETRNKIARVIAIGPLIMMKKVVDILIPYPNIEIIVSINTIMIDGIGMCGCCKVFIDNKIKFSCIDGPEFNGRLVDFKRLINKMT